MMRVFGVFEKDKITVATETREGRDRYKVIIETKAPYKEAKTL